VRARGAFLRPSLFYERLAFIELEIHRADAGARSGPCGLPMLKAAARFDLSKRRRAHSRPRRRRRWLRRDAAVTAFKSAGFISEDGAITSNKNAALGVADVDATLAILP